MNFFKNLGNALLKILWRLMLIVVVCILALNFSALIFLTIKNTTGYCNPFMDKIINNSIESTKEALILWANDN